jgi:hypothetical protein
MKPDPPKTVATLRVAMPNPPDVLLQPLDMRATPDAQRQMPSPGEVSHDHSQ